MNFVDESLNAAHFLFKHDDLMMNHSCGKENLHNVEFQEIQRVSNLSIKLFINLIKTSFEDLYHIFTIIVFFIVKLLQFKRSHVKSPIKGPHNSNKNSRYVEMVFVIDNKSYRKMKNNLAKVYSHCKELANIMNMVNLKIKYILYKFKNYN